MIKWNNKALKEFDEAIKKALLQDGAHLQGASIQQAPKDTGDLRGNCTVDDSRLDREKVVLVGYNLKYARRQHEELDYKHTDGKAKFLEDPYNENIQKYINHIANAIKEVTK